MAFAKKVHISIKAVDNVIKQLESSRTLHGYFIHTFIFIYLFIYKLCQGQFGRRNLRTIVPLTLLTPGASSWPLLKKYTFQLRQLVML